jgi:phage/plasmid primase-like uncharacterized protein
MTDPHQKQEQKKEEIRTAADIVQVIGEHVQLKKAGENFTGLCPFHNEKTPSFTVSPQKQTFKCFGCGESGDVFAFLMKQKNLSFPVAMQELADRYNIELTHPTNQYEQKTASKEKNGNRAAYIWSRSKSNANATETIKKAFSFRSIELEQIPPNMRLNSYKGKLSIACVMQDPFDEKTPEQPQCVHLTWLDNTGKKYTTKYQGKKHGLAIMLPGKDSSRLVLGEGLETTLSATKATGFSGMVCGDAVNMAGISKLPDKFREIFILVDSDTNHAGQKAAVKAVESIGKANPQAAVWLVTPDDSCFTDSPVELDFNDLLKHDTSGESIKARFEKKQRLDEIGKLKEQEQKKEAKPQTVKESWLPAEAQTELAKLNAEYAVVLMGGKLRIIQEGNDELFDKSTIDFLDKEAFIGFHKNRKVMVPTGKDDGMKKVDIGNLWMNWEERRSFKKVVFDPSMKCSSEAYNLFRGFSVKKKKGDWSKMKSHILNVICGGNEQHFNYFIQWMARMVQDPGGKRPGVTIVMKGKKGTGKSLVSEYFGSIFGDAYLPIANQHHILGNFNMHLSKCLFLFLDEAIWGGDKKAEGILKHLITSDVNMFEPKGIDSVAMKSYLNIMIASNEDWVIPATADERRFFALDVKMDLQGKEKRAYFNAIYDEMQNGGPAAMLHDLLEVDVDLDVLRDPPKTDMLNEQVELGLPEEHKFWQEVISRGHLLSYNDTGRPYISEGCSDPSDGIWPDRAYKYEIYKEYENFCKRLNLRRYSNQTWFWKRTWTIWPGGKPEGRLQGSNKAKNMVELYAIERMAEAFKEATGVRIDLGDDSPPPF